MQSIFQRNFRHQEFRKILLLLCSHYVTITCKYVLTGRDILILRIFLISTHFQIAVIYSNIYMLYTLQGLSFPIKDQELYAEKVLKYLIENL